MLVGDIAIGGKNHSHRKIILELKLNATELNNYSLYPSINNICEKKDGKKFVGIMEDTNIPSNSSTEYNSSRFVPNPHMSEPALIIAREESSLLDIVRYQSKPPGG